MSDERDPLAWRAYERAVASLEAESAGIDFTVTPNARLVGELSGSSRQIDVLIDARWGDDDILHRTIVDAKSWRSRVDVKDVESFEGMMRDCRAQRGVIVCASGWTAGALRRAQDAIAIRLLTPGEADELEWAYEECLGPCRAGEGLVLWDGQLLLPLTGWAIIWTGKCDRCHQFHVWCWDCGEKFTLTDEDERTCGCERSWVTAIEEQDSLQGTRSEAVHLIVATEENPCIPVDRRRLR